VEGATSLEIPPGALQGSVTGNYFHNIQAAFYVVNYSHSGESYTPAEDEI
jgi:hypothetical protein